MRVVQGWRSDPERELTDPLPEKKWSVVLRFVGGDWLDPISVGSNWFHPPYPKHVLHVWWPVVVVAIRFSYLVVDAWQDDRLALQQERRLRRAQGLWGRCA